MIMNTQCYVIGDAWLQSLSYLLPPRTAAACSQVVLLNERREFSGRITIYFTIDPDRNVEPRFNEPGFNPPYKE